MKRHLILASASFLILGSCANPEPHVKEETAMMKVTYPETRKDAVSDTLWGTVVEDPYRWLEDDNAPEVKDWVQAQNKATRSFLDSIPYRDAIRDRYEQLFNYEKVSSPFRVGTNYFISKNDGLQNQSVIYIRRGKDAEETVFLDPNTLSDDGTVTAGLMGASDDDKFMAITRNEAGSDWGEIRV
ncbi:MAG: prolyl oligopeptidase, partial [Flavobacteriales bacterium]